MTDAERTARLFKALASQARVRIIGLVRERFLCVNALAAALGISPAAVSQHLRVLREAGLVKAEKRGYYVHYRADARRLAELNRETARLLDPGKGGR